MVDNIAITPGTGATVATDEIGGFHFQRVKTTWGPDGTGNDVDVASGKPLPTQIRHSDGTIVTDATGIKISTSSLVAFGQGTAAASQPVVLASDQFPIAANMVSGTTAAMTATTSTLVLASPGAGLRNYITQITVTNAHATIGTDILIQDGSTTIYVIPAAPAWGGAVVSFPTPLRQPTLATAINAQNFITGANTKVSISGWKGA